MKKLNESQKKLFEKAVALCRDLDKQFWNVIEVLQEVENEKLYKHLDSSSLFKFAIDHLSLEREMAYPLITAARKCQEVPELGESLKQQRLSFGKATRILSTITPENAAELLAFAETHTTDQINQEVSRIRRGAGLPEKLRNLKVTDDTYVKVKRAQSVLSKSGKGKVDHDMIVSRAIDEFLERHDPVKKAERAAERKAKKAERADKPAGKENRAEDMAAHDQHGPVEQNDASGNAEPVDHPIAKRDTELCTYRVFKREPLTAEQRHQVFARDGGQCTHQDDRGRRCTNDRYLHIHHIQPVSSGGTNDPSNLTLLCSAHHDLAHQLAFPIDGQITWLRDNVIPYRVCEN